MSVDILPGRSSMATVPEYWPSAAHVVILDASVTFDAASRESAARWLPAADYEAVLATLVAENASQAAWEPDTPEQAADRAEITEALFDVQAGVIARGDDD